MAHSTSLRASRFALHSGLRQQGRAFGPVGLPWGFALGVEAQQVVPIDTGAADRRRQTEASMWSVPVVLVDPRSEVQFSLG